MADPTPRNGAEPGRASAAAAGALAAAVALAAGHLAGALTTETRSPVLVVGEGVIERVPVSVERFAIETFGSNDKLVLVIGITVVSLALGAVLGLLGRRRPVVAAVGFAGFGLVGALAALDRGAPVLAALLPSLVAALAGFGTLVALLRVAPARRTGTATTATQPEMPAERPKGDDPRSRRAFLLASGVAVAGVALLRTAGSAAAGRFSAAASRAGITLPRPARPLASAGAGVEAGVDGIAPFFTPNRDFYRVDTALSVPQVARRVMGAPHPRPGRPADDLSLRRARRPAARRGRHHDDVRLEHGRAASLVGNARWLGVPLRRAARRGRRAGRRRPDRRPVRRRLDVRVPRRRRRTTATRWSPSA